MEYVYVAMLLHKAGKEINESNVKSLGQEERKFVSVIPVKVLGYLIGAGANQEKPILVVRENFVDIKIPRERIVFSDSNEVKNSDGFIGVSSIFGVKKQ